MYNIIVKNGFHNSANKTRLKQRCERWEVKQEQDIEQLK